MENAARAELEELKVVEREGIAEMKTKMPKKFTKKIEPNDESNLSDGTELLRSSNVSGADLKLVGGKLTQGPMRFLDDAITNIENTTKREYEESARVLPVSVASHPLVLVLI